MTALFIFIQSVRRSTTYGDLRIVALVAGGRINCLAVLLLATAVLFCVPHRAYAGGTSYEEQISGFVSAVLITLITGEFSGQRPSNVGAFIQRPICKPNDYDDLRATTGRKSALDAFDRRCKLYESKRDGVEVHVTAYLPLGYCETIKTAFEAVLSDQVYSASRAKQFVTFEYKGSYYSGSMGDLARSASIQVRCRDDGSIRVNAKRKQQ